MDEVGGCLYLEVGEALGVGEESVVVLACADVAEAVGYAALNLARPPCVFVEKSTQSTQSTQLKVWAYCCIARRLVGLAFPWD